MVTMHDRVIEHHQGHKPGQRSEAEIDIVVDMIRTGTRESYNRRYGAAILKNSSKYKKNSSLAKY